MVEVLQHGDKNIIDCDFCGAKLKYMACDIKEKEHYIDQRNSEFIKYITCPDCKSRIELKKMYMGTV